MEVGAGVALTDFCFSKFRIDAQTLLQTEYTTAATSFRWEFPAKPNWVDVEISARSRSIGAHISQVKNWARSHPHYPRSSRCGHSIL